MNYVYYLYNNYLCKIKLKCRKLTIFFLFSLNLLKIIFFLFLSIKNNEIFIKSSRDFMDIGVDILILNNNIGKIHNREI